MNKGGGKDFSMCWLIFLFVCISTDFLLEHCQNLVPLFKPGCIILFIIYEFLQHLAYKRIPFFIYVIS